MGEKTLRVRPGAKLGVEPLAPELLLRLSEKVNWALLSPVPPVPPGPPGPPEGNRRSSLAMAQRRRAQRRMAQRRMAHAGMVVTWAGRRMLPSGTRTLQLLPIPMLKEQATGLRTRPKPRRKADFSREARRHQEEGQTPEPLQGSRQQAGKSPAMAHTAPLGALRRC